MMTKFIIFLKVEQLIFMVQMISLLLLDDWINREASCWSTILQLSVGEYIIEFSDGISEINVLFVL